ncbi:hypothetical protein [Ruegeria sp. HKCCD8929]|uniref:NYN domain-containing protein n=1 Tax=Ruegeria sp. HKCCD8929 TaxID=2683006 RepID=UPI0020C329DB|nr:hypothetical protein [Ruegeria sp. HKCCD8929]
MILLVKAWRIRIRVSGNWVIVDGSNVMHWKEGTPDIGTLHEVLSALVDAGLKPSVVFDANAGYKLADRHMNDRVLARALGLPVSRIMVAPKGTPADPLILRAARESGAQIVTNDRFRDWAEDYSDVLKSRAPVQGGYRQGKLWLSL